MGYQPSFDDLPAPAAPIGAPTQAGSYQPSIDDIPASQPNSVSQNLISQLNTQATAEEPYGGYKPPQVNTFIGKMDDPNDPVVKAAISASNDNMLIQALTAATGFMGGGLLAEAGLSGAGESGAVDSAALAKIPAQQQVNDALKEISGSYTNSGALAAAPKTAEENAAELSNRIFFSRNSAAANALQHKNNVIGTYGENNITAPVNFNGQMLGPDQLNQMQQMVRGNADQLQTQIGMAKSAGTPFNFIDAKANDSNIAGMQSQLGQHQALSDHLDQLQGQGLQYSSSDLSGINFGKGPGSINEAHNNFIDSPSLNNSDTLYQRFGDRAAIISQTPIAERSAEQIAEINNIKAAQKNIRTDQVNYLGSQDPNALAEWNLYSNKWSNNVGPFDDHDILSRLGRGEWDRNQQKMVPITSGITPSEINSGFSYQPEKTAKLSNTLGDAGQNNILYNQLQSHLPMTPADLSSSIKKLNQFGYQDYMTPQMKEIRDRMDMLSDQLGQPTTPSKIASVAKFVKDNANAVGLANITGHPWGALALKMLSKKS